MKTGNQLNEIKILMVGGKNKQWQIYQNTFKKTLPDWEVTINGCARVEEALENLHKCLLNFNIILVEDVLPGMSGLDFCKELQDLEVRLPKLLLLEKEREHLEVDALENGINDCIIKDRKRNYLKRLPIIVRRVILNFHNCVVRKTAKKELGELQEKILKVFMLSPNAIVLSTLKEGRTIEVNEAAIKETGYSREELIGKTSVEMGILKPRDRETMKRMLIEKGFYNNLEMKVYQRSGEELTCLLSAQIISLGGEECIIQSVTNISQRKKKQEQLLKSKNMESIGILAGGIARDFNSYLTSIMGNISIAKMSLHNTKKIHRALNRAEETSIKAADLAASLLTFSEGGEPIKKKNSIIDIIENTAEYHIKDTPVIINHRSEKKIWPVCGDETQLSQTFYNIFLNAVQAMPQEGEIIIETENVSLDQANEFSLEEGDYVKVSVKDTGIGIPAKNLDKIFDPFFTTKDTITHQGVGLGLSISQSIINKHNGTIVVDSTEGKGTIVTIIIPVYNEEPCQPF